MAPRETTWREAGPARSAPRKTPSTGPLAAAEDADTASGTPVSTARPRTDSSPPASLTDDSIVISSSLALRRPDDDDPLAAARILDEYLHGTRKSTRLKEHRWRRAQEQD
jgi:hypothetical protein